MLPWNGYRSRLDRYASSGISRVAFPCCRHPYGAVTFGLTAMHIHRIHELYWWGRIWCRLREWKPMHVELVGLSKLKNVRALDNKRVILPSDHFGIFAMFVRRATPGRRNA